MLKSNNIKKGFTIIEVIIVLVIAAIIMVMVFLVVPQLQQSQRNTKRQNYARQVLSAVNQFYANSPTSNLTLGGDITNITGTTAAVDPSTNSNYTWAQQSNGTTTAALTKGLITIATKSAKCNNGSSGTSFAAGSGYAVIIPVEPFSGNPETGLGYCVSDSQ
jgi:prepilin-type N-terminal cleavage/methylation domain-containing protein